MGERPRVVLFRQTELDGERLRAADRDGQRLAPGGIDENHRGATSAHRQYPAYFHLDRVGRAGSQAEHPDENHQAASAHGKPPDALINRTRFRRRSRYAIRTAGVALWPLSFRNEELRPVPLHRSRARPARRALDAADRARAAVRKYALRRLAPRDPAHLQDDALGAGTRAARRRRDRAPRRAYG